MIDITGWDYFYKMDVSGLPETTNMLYAPRVNSDTSIMCMDYGNTQSYLTKARLTKDTTEFFFNREVDNLTTFQQYSWAPKLLEVDTVNLRIFTEFSSNTVNRILLTEDRDLEREYPNWQNQMLTMLLDLDSAGYYKMALYPHCFYFTDEGVLKTFDFFSVISKQNHFIKLSLIQPIMGDDTNFNRFKRSEIEQSETMIDFDVFFEITMKEQLTLRWPNNPFPSFYDKLNNV